MKRWLKYVKPYWLFFVLGPICMIIESLGETFMPLLLKKITELVTILGNNPGTTKNGDITYIILFSVLMVVTAVVMMIGGIGGAYFGAKASVNFAADLRSDVYKKVQGFSFANIDKFSTGSLVTRLTNDVTQLQNFINMLLRIFLRVPIMLIGAVVAAICLKPDLAVILSVSVPIVMSVQFFVIKFGFPRFKQMQKMIDKLNSNIGENLTNIRVVKSFVREDFEKEKFNKSNTELKKAGINAMNIMIAMQPLMMFIMYGTTLAVLTIGGKKVVNGVMEAAALSTFITYITQILMSLIMFAMLFINSSRALASAKRITEVLDEKIDINDDNSNTELKVENGTVEFKNVSFRYYKNSPDKVLNNISFTINSGETVGIVGSTGCGKTTLVSLISRLYDADEGEVLVDGKNVKDYSLVNLRDGVGTVLQKNVLFSGTIKDNLKWGKNDADDSEILSASSNAQADLFVKTFPDGYDTVLVQGGKNVSGGQKQRLCIARALLKNPKILILDDSTSAVDTATEAKIRSEFAKKGKGTTRIIIAQRISSVMNADKIVVMNEGEVTGIGTHRELLKNNTEYKEIYASQMDKEA